MKDFRVIVAGGRYFKDYNLLCDVLSNLDKIKNYMEIVSGTARGADSLGERYANENNIPVRKFKPDWDKFGKAAGHIRNREMAKYGTHLIAFWDGKSKGTENMIQQAKGLGLKIKVIKY